MGESFNHKVFMKNLLKGWSCDYTIMHTACFNFIELEDNLGSAKYILHKAPYHPKQYLLAVW